MKGVNDTGLREATDCWEGRLVGRKPLMTVMISVHILRFVAVVCNHQMLMVLN